MKTYAIILAGGLGSRLRPFTYSIPKPLIKVQNKTILDYTIENLKKNNINNIILAIDYKAEKIIKYFENYKDKKTKIYFCNKTGHLGTGGSIKKAFDEFKIKNTFIVVNGDNIANYNFEEMIKEHKKNKAIATLALFKVKDTSQYGVIELKNNQIIKFIEKPTKKVNSNLINAGAYILEPKIINYLKDKKMSIEKEVFEKITKKERLFGFLHKKQWFPTDNFERFYIANKKLNKNTFIK